MCIYIIYIYSIYVSIYVGPYIHFLVRRTKAPAQDTQELTDLRRSLPPSRTASPAMPSQDAVMNMINDVAGLHLNWVHQIYIHIIIIYNCLYIYIAFSHTHAHSAYRDIDVCNPKSQTCTFWYVPLIGP